MLFLPRSSQVDKFSDCKYRTVIAKIYNRSENVVRMRDYLDVLNSNNII